MSLSMEVISGPPAFTRYNTEDFSPIFTVKLCSTKLLFASLAFIVIIDVAGIIWGKIRFKILFVKVAPIELLVLFSTV